MHKFSHYIIKTHLHHSPRPFITCIFFLIAAAHSSMCAEDEDVEYDHMPNSKHMSLVSVDHYPHKAQITLLAWMTQAEPLHHASFMDM